MKSFQKLILSVLLLLNTTLVMAQFGNEWIDYSKTYYKFSTWNNRMYRIPQSTLISAGISATVKGSELKMYKNGVEVPIFVSNNSVLSSNDFIEFQGSRASGNLDAELYTNAADQVNPYMNLMHDTAYYFLVVDNSAAHLRIINGSNIISSPPAAEPYCWDSIDVNYRNTLIKGFDFDYNLPVFESSRFEAAEGYVRRLVKNTSDSVNFTLANAYKVAGAPNIIANSIVLGYSKNFEHNVTLTLNGIDVDYDTIKNFGTTILTGSYSPTSLPSSNVLRYKITSSNTNNDDNIGFCNISIKYPRIFNFGAVSFKQFEIDPKPTTYYFEVLGFTIGSSGPPLLYDVTNNIVYSGDISASGKIKFQLPPSATVTKFYLISATITSRLTVTNLEPINFTDYSNSALQGDYLIMYSKNIIANVATDNIDQYKKYRESAAGGNYKVATVDFEQVYNQFGYGNNFHTAGVRRFLKYIKQNWTSTSPNYLFIIGKGIEYNLYNTFCSEIAIRDFKSIAPSFGIPGSDIVMTDLNFDMVPDFNVGRLSAYDNNDIKYYLDKVKEYEALINNANNQFIDSAEWKKRVLHIGGGNDANLQLSIASAFNRQNKMIQGAYYGGKVKTTMKLSTDPTQVLDDMEVNKMINSGIGIIQYYGHSASTTFAYALNQAADYFNTGGKYSTIIANGCDANNYFLYGANKSLTEDFITIPNSGSIAFIGSVNNGYPGFLDRYTDSLYKQFSLPKANTVSVSEQIKYTISKIANTINITDMMRPHLEQIQLHGDPVLKVNTFAKQDYAIEEKYLNFIPAQLNTTIDSFKINCKAFNLAKYNPADSIVMTIKRTFQNNSSVTYTKIFPNGIAWEDSMMVTLPLDKLIGKGVNTFTIKIDAYDSINEIFETNNTISKQMIIYDDDIIPIYPYNYSILHTAEINPNLIANTLNPFAVNQTYVVQIDTTANFNSSLLKSTTITSIGGVIEWRPNINMWDSVVYYWRCAKDTSSTNPSFNWNMYSFVYLSNGSNGWNQSHYYQYLPNNFNGLKIDANRKFNYVDKTTKLRIYNCKQLNPVPYNFTTFDYKGELNGDLLYTSACAYNVMHIIVIDSITGLPMPNIDYGGGVGTWGSKYCNRTNLYFEFNYLTAAGRKSIMNFLDSIPNGNYVAIYPHIGTGQVYAKHYMNDTLINGSGNSLYHQLKSFGFTQIDSFTRNKPWIFWFRKGMGSSYVQQYMAADSTQIISPTFSIPFKDKQGAMNSTEIGPSVKWKQLQRKGYAREGIMTDTSSVNIYGIDSLGVSTLIANVLGDTSIAFIDAVQYPKLRLEYVSSDVLNRSAEQLHFWRVMYDPSPDLALAPNITFDFANKYAEGQQAPLTFAVKNVSSVDMDSADVKVYVQDKNQNKVQTMVKRIAPLKAFDTTSVSYNFDTKGLQGSNTLFININPDKKPKENTYGNNFGYKLFDAAGDVINPNIDITFDGVRILKDDIVSSKPFIKIKVKDDNHYLRLDDTALVKCLITYPGSDQKVPIFFTNDSVKFLPANSSTTAENACIIEYTPYFKTDGIYELEVIAKDKSGNNAGLYNYKVSFEVVNKQMVSSLINYPNPFSTSTRFVFTLTGSSIPDNMKIQIMSITGRVVREITKPELGPLHIGKNITEYAWDGTDQFGEKLGNGVYFYRFITKNQNEDVAAKAIFEIDKYMKKGYGKMVIMR